MKNIDIKGILKDKGIGKMVILITSILLIYLSISLYFINHFYFNTTINGIDVSLKSYNDVDSIIKKSVQNYDLKIIERDGEIEVIKGEDIKLKYNEKNSIAIIYKKQDSFKWIIGLLNKEKYYLEDLFSYDKNVLEDKIKSLRCLNKEIIEPKNVSFKYLNNSYEVISEVYGNKLKEDKVNNLIKCSIVQGERKLELNKKDCYENPKYTLNSNKTFKTKNILNKYVSSKVTYIFGNEKEILEGCEVNKWITVNEDLDVEINQNSVKEYVKKLSKKYNTVGIERDFKTSTGNLVKVKGGYYGWKIDINSETNELLENIKSGEIIKKEPIYTQKALSRDKDDIGNTYVEINITSQHLWFYKNGKLITQGSIVTGDPNRGHATDLGVYMLNYKQENSVLRGQDYEAKVRYWMPFNGNIGIHDASWRYSFGGEIYKRNGSHGCINSPLYLAKAIFENIEEGIPIICYSE